MYKVMFIIGLCLSMYVSQAEIKQLIEFYQSPLGKKLTEGTTKVSKESIQVTQPWGMSLGSKLNSYLTEKGM